MKVQSAFLEYTTLIISAIMNKKIHSEESERIRVGFYIPNRPY